MFSSIIVVHIPWTITRAPTIWPIPTVASRPWPLAHVHAGAGQPGSSTAPRFSSTLATEHCSMLLWTNKLDRGLAKLLNVWVNGKETGRIQEFPYKKREPKIRSGKNFPRFRFRIYRIFPNFPEELLFPSITISHKMAWKTNSEVQTNRYSMHTGNESKLIPDLMHIASDGISSLRQQDEAMSNVTDVPFHFWGNHRPVSSFL